MNTLHTAKKNLIAHTVISCFFPLALIGCGDDSGTASAPNGADGLVSTMDDLLNCTANHEGETYFVTEQKSTYICVDNKWMDFAPTMDDLLNCTMNRESKTVYVNEHNSAYVCMDEKWYPQRDVPYIKEKSSSSVKSSSSDARFSSSIVTPTSSSSVTPQSSSSETSVSTGTMTDSRDGQTYKTVSIGSQTWMAQNLNYETANSYCYDDNASNCTKYGRLYKWAAATTACPEGWHLPTRAEFITLFTAVGGQSTAGKVLKSTSGWNSSRNGSDAFAFSALPAGYRDDDGYYDYEGRDAYFWSSTEGDGGIAYNIFLGGDYAYLNGYSKDYGFSVRCLKDETPGVEAISSSSVAPISSSSGKIEYSSSVLGNLVLPCKTELEDNCEYGKLEDSRDGQTYKTVTIDSQTWMAENLNFATDSSFCYNDSAEYCEKYGRLYRWAAAVGKSESECGKGYTCSLPSGNIQGVCPSGWHLPSKAEWETLFNAVGGQSTAGMILKSTSGWNSSGNGTDAFAFSALPAGNRSGNGVYYDEGNLANFWSSTEGTSDFAYGMRLSYDSDVASLSRYGKNYGFSVRCLKD